MITPAKTIFPWIKSFSQNNYFLLDEAYADFVEDPAFETGMTLVKEGLKNVLVTRTFSKFYALAGYRVGYLLAQPEVVEEVEKFMSLDNTNLAGAVAAVASLQDKTFAQLSFQSSMLLSISWQDQNIISFTVVNWWHHSEILLGPISNPHQ